MDQSLMTGMLRYLWVNHLYHIIYSLLMKAKERQPQECETKASNPDASGFLKAVPFTR